MDMSKTTFVERLERLRELNKEKVNFVNIDLYKLLCKKDVLIAAYERIKSNKGATTPAGGNISLDGFSLNRLNVLRNALLNESWRPRPARRIYIPKPGKKELRPLGIQGPEEKIVQAAMLFILEAIYEPIFSPYSYGFRPGIGCHNALKGIEQNYDGMTWAIEGDIKGMYDNVNHHVLISLVKKRVNDDRFIRLLWKLLRSGYMCENTLYKPRVGTPQGSIVSPILANVYLHELDEFVAGLRKKVTWRNNKVRTPVYKVLDNRMRKTKDHLDRCTDGTRTGLIKELREDKTRPVLLKELREDKMASLKVRMYTNPSDRIFYSRYADDFIVGVAGSEEYATSLKEGIRVFLMGLGLTLSPDKTKVTDIRKGFAFFLGHRIGICSSVKLTYIHPKGKRPHLKRVTGRLVTITAPIERIVERLSSKGFCDPQGFPTSKALWTSQEDNQIVGNFRATINGLFGFYSGVSRRKHLQRIWYILRFSCAYTLASKHRKSISKIFTKHGKLLTVNYGKTGEKSISLTAPLLREEDSNWQLGRQLADPYRMIAARVSKTKIYENCCICGCPSAEMHHIRHVKDTKSGFTTRIMGLINRKQIPVCLECHDSIHDGSYDGISLKSFVNPKVASR